MSDPPKVLGCGRIEKMKVEPGPPVQYALPLGKAAVPLNPLIGHRIRLTWTGGIECIHCSRKIKKTFQQGYCYPCFTTLAQCDQCVVKPELCHYDQGTCREPEWGRTHCLIPHTVYLANSSGLKVGITRGTDPTTRWIDQGAREAMAIRTVPNRLEAGRLEVAMKDWVGDKTNWRKMLKGDPEPIDLEAERDRLLETLATEAPDFDVPGEAPIDSSINQLEYPVRTYPSKLKSFNFDKAPEVEGVLEGIKGQYLLLDTGVLNVRKFGGYVLELAQVGEQTTD